MPQGKMSNILEWFVSAMEIPNTNYCRSHASDLCPLNFYTDTLIQPARHGDVRLRIGSESRKIEGHSLNHKEIWTQFTHPSLQELFLSPPLQMSGHQCAP